jgi:hypothetical protein
MTPQELEMALTSALEQSSDPPWTSIVAVFIWAGALVVAYFQLRNIAAQIEDAKDAINKDHDRTRRERTVEILKYYQEGTKPEHNKVIELLDLMAVDQLKNLREGKPITLSGELKEIACSVLSGKFPEIYFQYCGDKGEKKNESHVLSHAETLHLRFIMLDILNHYETCLVPWHLGIVDQETIEAQFFPLVDKRDGKFKLHAAREAFGTEKFPATEAFREKLFSSNNVTQPKSPITRPTK